MCIYPLDHYHVKDKVTIQYLKQIHTHTQTYTDTHTNELTAFLRWGSSAGQLLSKQRGISVLYSKSGKHEAR